MSHILTYHLCITGSTASSGSDGDNQYLHAGVCIKELNVSTKDANIAKEALELLVTCLQLRSELLGRCQDLYVFQKVGYLWHI